MKVYHSNTSFGLQRVNKIRAVAALTGSTVQFEANEKAPALQKLFRATLPILETPEGAIHSSNTIIRFLANSTKKLYGSNIQEASLVDQWLDVTAFDFEPAVATLNNAVEGVQGAVFNAWKDANTFLTVVNDQLAKSTYLVGGSISIADISLYVNLSVLFQHAFDAKVRGQYPNLGKWFEVVAKEIGNALPAVTLCEKTHENLACSRKEKAPKGAEKKGAEKKPAPAAEKKEEEFDLFGGDAAPTPAKKEEEFDLFGGDDTAAPAEAEKKPEAPKPEAKKKKVNIAKSIVTFEVKVYEEDVDFDALAKKIFDNIELDGLVWNKDYKILPVAYTIKKLQVGCVVEDLKVSTDDILEKIEEWEEVQSTDIVSFQKL